MSASYKKLFKLMVDRNMKKKDLVKIAGISTSTVGKLAKNENVTAEVIEKICLSLNCSIEDILEFVHDNTSGKRSY